MAQRTMLNNTYTISEHQVFKYRLASSFLDYFTLHQTSLRSVPQYSGEYDDFIDTSCGACAVLKFEQETIYV
ncbi:hypothetical protein T265_09057 [Opisthorchis viverrini]|uniref:Uncharacterized protein n=1 Tax=Opisthorchis viverrini TaxID=6198 RepID=A0A074ZBK2_OPIVI|nr:hypothetical protein T265_09057 [Opisthorchis viverrini]KER22977.1 hypothetical protein T265_09057 [Opisthorchis viverrini]